MTSTATAAASAPELSSVTRVTVAEKDTVGALVPGMPYVAATPYLVGIAELACGRLVQDLLEPGQITVGSRVVIDHLGPSKVEHERAAVSLQKLMSALG
jgi:fluoroacetyl-CoA thioesterase